jgi:hypothetical protein
LSYQFYDDDGCQADNGNAGANSNPNFCLLCHVDFSPGLLLPCIKAPVERPAAHPSAYFTRLITKLAMPAMVPAKLTIRQKVSVVYHGGFFIVGCFITNLQYK